MLVTKLIKDQMKAQRLHNTHAHMCQIRRQWYEPAKYDTGTWYADVVFVDTGPKTITVRLQAGHTLVGHVRDQVSARAGIDKKHQRLMFAGKQLLGDDHTLEHYGVTEQCTLHLLGRVRGGHARGRQRWLIQQQTPPPGIRGPDGH